MRDEADLREESCGGGGGGLNSKRQKRMLDWRMDPEQSRSDFVIEVAEISSKDGENEGGIGGASHEVFDTSDGFWPHQRTSVVHFIV